MAQTTFSTDYIKSLKQAGDKDISIGSIEEIRQLNRVLKSSHTFAVRLDNRLYLKYGLLSNITFVLNGNEHLLTAAMKLINGLEKVDIINADIKRISFSKFLFDEIFQGNKLSYRILRLTSTLVFLLFLNVFAGLWLNSNSLESLFTAILTAISIFIALFSIFVAGNKYDSTLGMRMFIDGQTVYYSKIDEHISRLGVLTIIIALLLVLVSSGYNPEIPVHIYSLSDVKDIIVIVGLNMTALSTYWVLRSLREFYVVRPGKYTNIMLLHQIMNEYKSRHSK